MHLDLVNFEPQQARVVFGTFGWRANSPFDYGTETSLLGFRNCSCYVGVNNAQDIRMNPIDLIITVCAVLSPTTCEEAHLTFSYSGSLRQCAMAAPPYIAQWVGEHPKWTAVKWRCEYPHTNDKVENSGATPAG